MWYKVEDKLPEMACSDYGWKESEKLLVKTRSGAVYVACYCGYVDCAPYWKTNCSEGWDITKEVTEWTEIPE